LQFNSSFLKLPRGKDKDGRKSWDTGWNRAWQYAVLGRWSFSCGCLALTGEPVRLNFDKFSEVREL